MNRSIIHGKMSPVGSDLGLLLLSIIIIDLDTGLGMLLITLAGDTQLSVVATMSEHEFEIQRYLKLKVWAIESKMKFSKDK